MKKINEKITHWLLNTWKPSLFQLGITRIAYCLGFFIIGIPQFVEISQLELVFFDPPIGISKVLGPITSYNFWWTFDLILRICFIFLLVGFRTKWSSIGFGLLLIFGFTFKFSYGKIDHDIFAVIFPIIMAFTNWGDALSIDALSANRSEKQPIGWPLTFLSFLIGWGYFTAGLPKFLGDWLDPFNSTTAGFLLRSYHSGGTPMYLMETFINLNSLFVFKLMDYSTLIFELGAIFTIVSCAWFLRGIGIAALFHLGVLLTLNIAFSFHVLVFLPYLAYFYLPDNAAITQRIENFFSVYRKPLWIVAGLLSFVILLGFYPEGLRELRIHGILALICIPSILMVVLVKSPSIKEISGNPITYP